MARRIKSAAFIAALLIATPAAADIYVLDGDTIVVDREHIRLTGFNTPETRDAQCESERALGYRAKARLRDLLTMACGPLARAPAGCLTLERLPTPDRYGRSLARLTMQGRDVAEILISEGLAEPYDCAAGHCPRRRNWCGEGP
ncbi:thermonuclease family protein [Ancylobacter sp. WKF20]|uniref:thermonuclease family protein n=1 Tax=Ancylobacter sp. WKF20 TaxID=3039801 RepID=UPI0024344EB3|nr:thermonuclease family protein [Ancylobacter sp. WKF20]WGD31252.1 thermonuclease family protein [Ancylobacter sp. WKF20]